MIELNENEVILDKDEYCYLKDMADRYDPFWFCTFGGCEGVCKECKDTCEMSIFVKERKETAEKIYKDIKFFLDDKTLAIIKRYFKEILNVEIKG
jgi:hypothetical protein